MLYKLVPKILELECHGWSAKTGSCGTETSNCQKQSDVSTDDVEQKDWHTLYIASNSAA